MLDIGARPQGFNICGHDNGQVPCNLFNWPVPPSNFLKRQNDVLRETFLDYFCRVASDYGIGRYIGNDYGTRGNDCTIADVHAGYNETVIPYPDVVSNDSVAFVREVIGLGHDLFPPITENLEWIGGDAGNLVVCAVHDELDATGYRAKPSDDQAITNERKVVKDITFKVL